MGELGAGGLPAAVAGRLNESALIANRPRST